jgi:fatty acid desaturase
MKDFKIPKHTEQVIPQIKNLLKSLVLLGLVVGSFFLTQAGVDRIDASFLAIPDWFHFVLKWGFIIGLALVNNVLIMGLGILGHEAAHRVLFNSVFWNDFCGGIFGALLLLPFHNFRNFHFTHHSHTHQPGLDPEEPVNNHPIWFALIGGALIGLYIHYKTLAVDLLSGSRKQQYQALKDVFSLSIVGAFYFYIVPIAGISILYTVVPTLVLLPLVFMFRNLSEHHGIPKQVRKSTQQTENPNVDSWIVLTNPLMTWLWSNTNYHQVHHRYPYLSYRYFPEIFEATKHEQPYAVVNGYFRCTINSLKRAYYASDEDLKPFLTTKSAVNS